MGLIKMTWTFFKFSFSYFLKSLSFILWSQTLIKNHLTFKLQPPSAPLLFLFLNTKKLLNNFCEFVPLFCRWKWFFLKLLPRLVFSQPRKLRRLNDPTPNCTRDYSEIPLRLILEFQRTFFVLFCHRCRKWEKKLTKFPNENFPLRQMQTKYPFEITNFQILFFFVYFVPFKKPQLSEISSSAKCVCTLSCS